MTDGHRPGTIPAIPRRTFAALVLGVASVPALGACMRAQPNQDDGTGGGGEGAQNPDGVFHGAYPYVMPPTGHFNFTPGLTQSVALGIYREFTLPAGALWDWAAQQWLYLVAESHDFDEKQFTYKLRSGMTWSDDSPVTTKDVELTFWLRWLMNQQEWPMISGLKTTDESTVTFELTAPSTMIDRRILKAPILPASVYGTFGERAKEIFEAGQATDSPQANALREEVSAWRPKDNATEVLSSGPFHWDIESMTDARLTLVKREKGLFADQVKFTTIHLYNGETNDITPLVLDGTIDYATHGFPVSTQKNWESDGHRTLKPAVYAGMSIIFGSNRHREFTDARFRQALAHAVDRAEAGLISLDASAKVSETMSGMPSLLEARWLDEATKAKLNPYPFDQDKAAALLEEAGWKRSNNAWAKPDGKPAEYQFTFPSDYADYPPSAQYYAEKLTKFGIKIALDGIESPNMTDRIYTSRFDLATASWGGQEVHPHYAYSTAFINDNEPIARNQGGRGMDFDLKRNVPGIGQVDIQDLVTKSGQGLYEEEQKTLINQLALIFNYELPRLPAWERFGNNPGQEGPRVKAFPADDDPIWQSAAYIDNPVIMSLYRGTIIPS
jgi:peptide/nickel transport system substrate-binding protein